MFRVLYEQLSMFSFPGGSSVSYSSAFELPHGDNTLQFVLTVISVDIDTAGMLITVQEGSDDQNWLTAFEFGFAPSRLVRLPLKFPE